MPYVNIIKHLQGKHDQHSHGRGGVRADLLATGLAVGDDVSYTTYDDNDNKVTISGKLVSLNELAARVDTGSGVRNVHPKSVKLVKASENVQSVEAVAPKVAAPVATVSSQAAASLKGDYTREQEQMYHSTMDEMSKLTGLNMHNVTPSVTFSKDGSELRPIMQEWGTMGDDVIQLLDNGRLGGVCFKQDNSIYVLSRNYGKEQLRTALIHEVGHAIQNTSASKAVNAWKDKYKKDQTFDRHTEYSKTSAAEGFAESFVAYTNSKGKSANPKTQKVFDVIDETIETRYGGAKSKYKASEILTQLLRRSMKSSGDAVVVQRLNNNELLRLRRPQSVSVIRLVDTPNAIISRVDTFGLGSSGYDDALKSYLYTNGFLII